MRPNPPWVWMKNIKNKQVQFLEMCNVWFAMLTLRYSWETNQPKALDSTVEVDKIKGDWSSRQWHNFFWKYLYAHITDTLPRDTWKLSGRAGRGLWNMLVSETFWWGSLKIHKSMVPKQKCIYQAIIVKQSWEVHFFVDSLAPFAEFLKL
jgi:hypothetical protein